jgi:hypothetical protein
VTGKVVLMDYGDRSLNGTTHGGVGAFDIYEAQNGYKAKLWYEVRLRLDLMGGEIPDKLVYGHGKGLLGDRKLLVGIWDNWNEEWYNGPFDGDDHTGDHTAWTGLYAYGGTMSGAEGNGWKAGVLVSWVKKEDGEGNVYWLMDIGARPEANANKPWNHKISGDPQEANHWYIKSGELPMEMGMSVEAYEGGLPDVYICIPEF